MTLAFTPADWLALFTHFLTLSLLAVGGAITTAPDMHRYLVTDQHWLTEVQFTSSIALAQAAPGPNVLFVALMGWNVGLNAGGGLGAGWHAAALGLVDRVRHDLAVGSLGLDRLQLVGHAPVHAQLGEPGRLRQRAGALLRERQRAAGFGGGIERVAHLAEGIGHRVAVVQLGLALLGQHGVACGVQPAGVPDRLGE